MSQEDREDATKGPWKQSEDESLKSLIEKHGIVNWSTIAQSMPGRNGKSCRLRWFNQLSPELRKEPFTASEDDLIIQAHYTHGNKWSLIAKLLKGRTDNAVKNRWNSTLRRRVEANGGHENMAGGDGSVTGLVQGGVLLQEVLQEFETLQRMFKLINEENQGTPEFDFASLMGHLKEARHILMPALSPSQAEVRAGSLPIHFDEVTDNYNKSSWSLHPARRMPGLPAATLDVAARAMEPNHGLLDDDETFSTHTLHHDRIELSGFHSPNVKGERRHMSMPVTLVDLEKGGIGNSLLESFEDGGLSAMSSASRENLSPCGPSVGQPPMMESMPCSGRYRVESHERHQSMGSSMDTDGVLVLGQTTRYSGSSSFDQDPSYEANPAQLYRRFSAPDPGTIRYSSAPKRPRTSGVANPFDNMPDNEFFFNNQAFPPSFAPLPMSEGISQFSS